MDGPGMEYSWVDYELCGEWKEAGVSEERNPVKLKITKNTVELKRDGTVKKFGYKLPENTDPYGKPDGEIHLELQDCDEYESLIFHEEKADDGTMFPVLSGTLFEFDGRGEIVVAEYVPEWKNGLPDDFQSEAAYIRNYEVPPMDIAPIVYDGEIMAYHWISEDLCGEWKEVNTLDGFEPAELTVNENEITYKCGDYTETFEYSLPKDTVEIGTPDGEIYLELKNCGRFESMIFHEENANHTDMFPVLSGTLFELDGRGEVVISEFVHKDKADLPEGFESESLKKRNCRTDTSMANKK